METVTGIYAIALSILLNFFFFRLGKDFEYPNILKQSSKSILKKFHSNARSITKSWYGFMLSSVLFAPLTVLIYYAFQTPQHQAILGLATACGLVAAVLQTLGLARWVFAVPYLAQIHSTAKSQTQKQTIETIFKSQHKYLGEGIGEHLGYFFTALWTILLAVYLLLTGQLNLVLAASGIVVGIAIALGMLEAFGQKWAGAINAIGYILWSLWVISMGIALII